MLYYRHKREGKAVRNMKRVVETKIMRRAFEQRRRPLKISKWGAWVNRKQQRTVFDRFIACAFIFPQTGDATTVGKTEQPRRSNETPDRKYPKWERLQLCFYDLEGPLSITERNVCFHPPLWKSSLRKSRMSEKEIGSKLNSFPESERAIRGNLPRI